MKINPKKCLICNGGRKNDTIYVHMDRETGNVWLWCNKCNRGYSLQNYCAKAGIKVEDFLSCSAEIEYTESSPNEVNKVDWPNSFISLNDPRAKKGIEYLNTRQIEPRGDIFYDLEDEGIVFPYYFQNVFCGAQIRFVEPRTTKDGDTWKITTMPGTKLGILIYGYNQDVLMPNVKGVIVCEGAFNALSIQQSLDELYGKPILNPFKAVACSGSGAARHHVDVFKDLISRGYKVIVAPDKDEAGLKMLDKYLKAQACTHYLLTETVADWNDEKIRLGNKSLAKYILKNIKAVTNEIP